MQMVMRRRMVVGSVAALAIVGLVGCGGSDSGSRTSAASTPTDEAGGPRLEGSWTRVATSKDADELQLDAALASQLLGPDGELPVDLEVTADEWKVYVTSDQGERELGDFGTWRIDDEGRWVTRSETPTCRGCEITYRVDVDGDRLTTEVDDGDAAAADHHLVTEGTWTTNS